MTLSFTQAVALLLSLAMLLATTSPAAASCSCKCDDDKHSSIIINGNYTPEAVEPNPIKAFLGTFGVSEVSPYIDFSNNMTFSFGYTKPDASLGTSWMPGLEQGTIVTVVQPGSDNYGPDYAHMHRPGVYRRPIFTHRSAQIRNLERSPVKVACWTLMKVMRPTLRNTVMNKILSPDTNVLVNMENMDGVACLLGHMNFTGELNHLSYFIAANSYESTVEYFDRWNEYIQEMVAEESSTSAPEESSTSAPEESSTSAPEESSTSAPEESSTSAPEESSTSSTSSTSAPEEN